MDTRYRLHAVSFVWDEQKARVNAAKHGVTFKEAVGVFFDQFVHGGDASVAGEKRDSLLGYSEQHRLLFVVYTESSTVRRLISARPATRAERKRHVQR